MIRGRGPIQRWSSWRRKTPPPLVPVTATANPTEVVLAETDTGRGVLGVIDGFSPKGVENESDIKWRRDFLRQIGYKA